MSSLDDFQKQDFDTDYRLNVLFSLIPKGGDLLDLGSGNGIIAKQLHDSYNSITLSDNSEALVNDLRSSFESIPKVKVLSINAQNFATEKKFDIISACDILEHVENDEGVMKSVQEALKKNGTFFISVPAFQWLYGVRDKTYGHLRRYSKKELRTKLRNNGFVVESIFYWNALGVVPYLISEKIFKKPLVAPARKTGRNPISKLLNYIIWSELKMESMIGVPAGLSLVAICKKK